MNTRIPEDLSDLPDVQSEELGAAPLPPAAPVPEDVGDLPDAPEPAPGAPPAAEAARRSGAVARTATLVALAVVGVAAAVAVVEIHDLVLRAYRMNAVLGVVTGVLTAVLAGLIGLVVAREVRGYLRLKTVDGLRGVFHELGMRPRDPDADREVRREVRQFLAALETPPEAELSVRIERLRERLAIAESTAEWEEDIERILLRPMDEEAYQAIRREAVNVAVATALSPYGFLDALIALWRNIRLVGRIAAIYRLRAGRYGTFVILRRTIAAAALADLAHEASLALLGTTRSVTSLIGAHAAQGATNALLTIRVGLKCQEQCRPLAMPAARRQGMMRMMLSTVRGSLAAIGGRRRRADDEPDAADPDGTPAADRSG
ncbi:MAG: DUF697 domain-containing protein [Candidatus Brocadiaceae bacterium]|nr:DUF697 domain-containing protein [Candidatus Brocadiaceae bacterium]